MATWETVSTITGSVNDAIYYNRYLYWHDDGDPLSIKRINVDTGVQETIGDATDFGFDPYLQIDENHPLCVFKGSIYVCFNENPGNVDMHVYKYDIDLDTWTSVFSLGSGAEYAWSLVTDGISLLFISRSDTAPPKVRYSTDGVVWQNGTLSGFTPQSINTPPSNAEEFQFIGEIWLVFNDTGGGLQACKWDGVSSLVAQAAYTSTSRWHGRQQDLFWTRATAPAPDQYSYNTVVGVAGTFPVLNPAFQPLLSTYNIPYTISVDFVGDSFYYWDGSWVLLEAYPGTSTSFFMVKDSFAAYLLSRGASNILYKRSESLPGSTGVVHIMKMNFSTYSYNPIVWDWGEDVCTALSVEDSDTDRLLYATRETLN